MTPNLCEILGDVARKWKFDPQSSETHGKGLVYAFFVEERCVAISTLHFDAALQIFSELIDDDDITERFVVRLMPHAEAIPLFGTRPTVPDESESGLGKPPKMHRQSPRG